MKKESLGKKMDDLAKELGDWLNSRRVTLIGKYFLGSMLIYGSVADMVKEEDDALLNLVLKKCFEKVAK